MSETYSSHGGRAEQRRLVLISLGAVLAILIALIYRYPNFLRPGSGFESGDSVSKELSQETAQIEADLNSVNLSDLDRELSEIDGELFR